MTDGIEADALRWRAVLELPSNLNGKLFLICMQAIAEGDGNLSGDPHVLLDLPKDEFCGLAERAGIDRTYRYRLYRQLTQPPKPGACEAETQDLYRHYDDASRLLYIGISGRLLVRDAEHRSSSRWRDLIARSASEQHPGRVAVLAAERTAIETEQPLFNRQYNDTPEARERLRCHLEEIGRMDLMWD